MRKILALVLIGVFACAACVAQAEPVKLAYKFRAGEIDKYKLRMRMAFDVAGLARLTGQQGPMCMDFSIIVRQKTLGIYPDGSAKVLVSCGEPKINMPGMPAMPKSKQPVTLPELRMVLAPDGSLRRIEGLEKALGFKGAGNVNFGAADFSQFMNLMGQQAVFPSEPLEVGSSWENTIPMPFSGAALKVRSTLISDNMAVGKNRAACIQQNFDGSLDMGQVFKQMASMVPMKGQENEMLAGISGGAEMFGNMNYYFSPTLGKILKGSGEMAMSISISMPQKVTEMGGPPRIDMTANITYDLMKIQ
jgi:hypothetical protein